MNKIQSLPRRSLRIGVVAGVALCLAAFAPARDGSHLNPGASLGVNGSANAVEHRLLTRLDVDLGVDGSANAVEHRLTR